MMSNVPGLSPEELERQQAAELPNREAMSLINTDPSTLMAYPGTGDDMTGLGSGLTAGGATGDTTGGTADAASTAADDASSLAGTTADASGSESEPISAVEEDRSEQFSQEDSAYAGPS
jgi:hypothetical protein